MSATWGAVFVPILLAIAAGIWTLALMIGGLREEVRNLGSDATDLKHRLDEHDRWHLRRLEQGLDQAPPGWVP